MIKIIGSLILIISGALIGKNLCNNIKNKIKFLEDFKKFVFYSKCEIEFKKTSPKNITENFECNSVLKKFFKNLIYLIQNGENFPGAWEKTFKICKFDENKIILNFGKEFGSYNLENQIETCNLALNNISFVIKNLKKDIDKNEKLFTYLGACFGVIICIIFF